MATTKGREHAMAGVLRHSERSKNLLMVKFRVISDLPRLFLHFTYINFSVVIMLGILTFSFNLQISNISRYR
jgi:hypothetical protein